LDFLANCEIGTRGIVMKKTRNMDDVS